MQLWPANVIVVTNYYQLLITVCDQVLHIIIPQHAPQDPQRREASRMWRVRQEVHSLEQPLLPQDDACQGTNISHGWIRSIVLFVTLLYSCLTENDDIVWLQEAKLLSWQVMGCYRDTETRNGYSQECCNLSSRNPVWGVGQLIFQYTSF